MSIDIILNDKQLEIKNKMVSDGILPDNFNIENFPLDILNMVGNELANIAAINRILRLEKDPEIKTYLENVIEAKLRYVELLTKPVLFAFGMLNEIYDFLDICLEDSYDFYTLYDKSREMVDKINALAENDLIDKAFINYTNTSKSETPIGEENDQESNS